MKKIDGEPISYFDASTGAERMGEQVQVNACVHKIRKMSEFAFVILRTGRYTFQSLWNDQCKDSLDGIREGMFVTITGTIQPQKRAPFGYEILLSSITPLTTGGEEYPLRVSKKKLGASLETNLDNRSVALRNPMERAVFQISQGITLGFQSFMLAHFFTEIHTPKIVSAGAEGGANLFPLEYFDQRAYLAQSPQFYKQTGVAIFDRVFEIAPVYRAEKHNTSRHLNEYIGLDFEMGYINDMYDVMDMETAMLEFVLAELKEKYVYELELLEKELPVLEGVSAITFMDAMEILGYTRAKSDLDPEDEVRLCKWAKEETGSDFLFVTHFPSAKRPFYAMDDPEDSRFALSFDLLCRGLEVTTGGQRIHEYDEQVAKLARYQIEPEELENYLRIHKYGMPPHGGAGIGLERLVMTFLSLSNVRMASLFPRDVTRLDP